jgi:2-phosphosulfolactate phosphatase
VWNRQSVLGDHGQRDYRVRFDWGLAGAVAVTEGVHVAVVVDVLSFTTTVTVALDHGVDVLPYRWRDDSAVAYARARGAGLAEGRSARRGGLTLSPASLREARTLPRRLVIPSPNGSTIAHYLSDPARACVAASLRNVGAVASWLDGLAQGATVAVVAAGERWPDGGLRPAVEDLWGAGALIAALHDRGWSGLSPEADSARVAYEHIRGRELQVLLACASGRELSARGYDGDVSIAAEVDRSGAVAVLRGDAFVAA